ncbi:unnamed protein product [Caenorhabditis angaria]|uniref:non-specific serine/threonine protein kinase n=1 Tax=Caenorhabditis angaria TaxID=860376 RepID=A0A9P1IDH1_9PELO|nr:unnamed protein product [Caenorhabditis angaria]
MAPYTSTEMQLLRRQSTNDVSSRPCGKIVYAAEKVREAIMDHEQTISTTTTPIAPKQRAKVVVLGDSGVGKTSIIYRHRFGTQFVSVNATIGASFVSCDCETERDESIRLQVWDTAGQERFRCMVPMYMRNADAALIVYDVTNRESFEDVDKWMDELERSCGTDQTNIYLIGNKTDLVEKREISTVEGKAKAVRINAKFYEVSSDEPDLFSILLSDVAEDVLSARDRINEISEEIDSKTSIKLKTSKPMNIEIGEMTVISSPKKSKCCSLLFLRKCLLIDGNMKDQAIRKIRSEPPTYASIQEDTVEEEEEPDASDSESTRIPPKFVATQRSHDESRPCHSREDTLSRSVSAQSLPVSKLKEMADMTPYERTLYLLANDQMYQKEVALGKRIGFYRLGKELGAGNFSKVKLGIHVLTKEKVAVKIMDKAKMDQKAQKLLAREIQSMEKMNHPNIIKIFECVETLTRVHLVIEYASGGELYAYIHEKGKLSEADAKPLFAQIVSAVAHMHSRSLVHRDIKAENVMFSGPGTVKLVDFGFSCLVQKNTNLETFCGSPPYAAPELFRDKSYVGELVDVWALGVLLYFMLVGVTPFRGETVAELKTIIMTGQFQIPEYVTLLANHLLSAMLQTDVTKRADIEDVKKNYWMRDCRFTKSYLSIKTDVSPENDEAEKAEVNTRVWRIMNSYGIQKEMLDEDVREKGPRDSIIGTYRIVQYQVQAEVSKGPKEKEESSSTSNGNSINNYRDNRKLKNRSKTCSVKNLSFPHVFSTFPEDFENTTIFIEKARGMNTLFSSFSCIFSFFTCFIVMKHSSKLKTEYRNILFCQLLLAGSGAIFMCLVSPFILLPYPVLLTTGPFVVSHKITLYLNFTLYTIYFFPTMLLLSFGLIYNFISLRTLHTSLFNISIDRLLKILIFCSTLFLLVFNTILFLALFDMDHHNLQNQLIKNIENGEKVVEIFQNYGAFAFDINSWPIFMASLEAIILSFLTFLFCFIMVMLSWNEYEKQKQSVSQQVSRNHRMMLYMLISYVSHFLIFFAIPLTLFTISLHSTTPLFGRMTFTIIMSPAHILGISLSITYCIIITPYRNVVSSYIFILTCSHPSNRCYNASRPDLQLSTIDNSVMFRRNSFVSSSAQFS